MLTVTLLSDYGCQDPKPAIIKGLLLRNFPNINVVDITHQICPFDYIQTAYILKSSYQYFPKNSIHLVFVDTEITPEHSLLVLFYDGHYFICNNNGILSIFEQAQVKGNLIEVNTNGKGYNAQEENIFVSTLAKLVSNHKITDLGNSVTHFKKLLNVTPFVSFDEKKIIGSVIHIDNFGNTVSNITKVLFERIRKNRQFRISARSITLNNLYDSYSQWIDFSKEQSERNDAGKELALLNSFGHLELAIYKGNPKTVGGASSLLGINKGDKITVDFF